MTTNETIFVTDRLTIWQEGEKVFLKCHDTLELDAEKAKQIIKAINGLVGLKEEPESETKPRRFTVECNSADGVITRGIHADTLYPTVDCQGVAFYLNKQMVGYFYDVVTVREEVADVTG